MPTQQTILSFKEGIKILQQVRDFASLRETIDRMVSLCPPEDVPFAKDAIARVIRIKQAEELNMSRGSPQVIDTLDKKYRDLYIVLRTSKSKTPLQPHNPSVVSNAAPKQQKTQLQKASPLGGLNFPLMVADWLKSKKKYIITGGAVMSTIGGAVLLYKYFNNDDESPSKDSKESGFDKTIRSIQKYRAFSQMANDPNFSGNFTEILDGSYNKKKKKVRKKEEPLKSAEWDRNEKVLMKDMNDAFNTLSTRPRLEYALPQLPAPKDINPIDVVGSFGSRPTETKIEKPKKKTRKPRKTRKTRDTTPKAVISTTAEDTKPPKKPRQRKVSTTSSTPAEKKVKNSKPSSSHTSGRLIPIVKRTKRVRKVKT